MKGAPFGALVGGFWASFVGVSILIAAAGDCCLSGLAEAAERLRYEALVPKIIRWRVKLLGMQWQLQCMWIVLLLHVLACDVGVWSFTPVPPDADGAAAANVLHMYSRGFLVASAVLALA